MDSEYQTPHPDPQTWVKTTEIPIWCARKWYFSISIQCMDRYLVWLKV